MLYLKNKLIKFLAGKRCIVMNVSIINGTVKIDKHGSMIDNVHVENPNGIAFEIG